MIIGSANIHREGAVRGGTGYDGGAGDGIDLLMRVNGQSFSYTIQQVGDFIRATPITRYTPTNPPAPPKANPKRDSGRTRRRW